MEAINIISNFGEKVNFIWNIANLSRGPYKPEKYSDIILPLSILRCFDCILELTKDKVLEKAKEVDITKFNFNNLLFLVVKEFNKLDLHPEKVSNQEMG